MRLDDQATAICWHGRLHLDNAVEPGRRYAVTVEANRRTNAVIATEVPLESQVPEWCGKHARWRRVKVASRAAPSSSGTVMILIVPPQRGQCSRRAIASTLKSFVRYAVAASRVARSLIKWAMRTSLLIGGLADACSSGSERSMRHESPQLGD